MRRNDSFAFADANTMDGRVKPCHDGCESVQTEMLNHLGPLPFALLRNAQPGMTSVLIFLAD
ncbi:MAG TPA: hypothetical protein VK779_09350, partial [Rhizomicrobium sp.]|nr:hypothetical protein [Rhizomicrobium sp.]